MYPYNLTENPFPSAPTPGVSDIFLLGGKRHKKSKASVISCLEDMGKKIHEDHSSKQFRLVTVIHDVGSGKTHLALHLRTCNELSDKAIVSFTDMSQLYPRTINNFYKGMITGFHRHIIDSLRCAFLNYLREKAESDKKAKKIFKYSIWDKLRATSLGDKTQLVLDNKLSHDEIALQEVLAEEFSAVEIAMIQSILSDKLAFQHSKVNSLEEIILNICAFAKLTLLFLNRITVFEIDEFDTDIHSMDILKALINAHVPSALLLLVLTPSAYYEIKNTNVSLFDRLEKANYKIDLAGSNTLDEISDIVLEYMRSGLGDKAMGNREQEDLLAKIKILYDEFPDFRNIRSMINVMYHAVEYAAKNGSQLIDEQSLDEMLTTVYPGLRLRDSIMGVPLSEFMKIARESKDVEKIKSSVELAINALLNCANVSRRAVNTAPLQKNGNFIDVTYDDFVGKKTAVEISINEGNRPEFEGQVNRLSSEYVADNLTIFSNNENIENRQRTCASVTIDRHKLVDLIYFNKVFKDNQMQEDDIERALALGRSIKLY
jgi:hypothetical protein